MDIASIRREYRRQGIDREDLSTSPFDQFRRWFAESEAWLEDPTAMVLATSNLVDQISQRIVLLKEIDEQGLAFYTNYASRKAAEMNANPRVSALFPWHSLDRQVIIHGSVDKLTREASQKYFSSRPQASRLSAWASPQSRIVPSRAWLEARVLKYQTKFSDGEIPLPDFWGGYRLIPSRFEFWQGRSHRLHDRFEYLRNKSADWTIHRLAP